MRNNLPRNLSFHRRPSKGGNLFQTKEQKKMDHAKLIKGVDKSSPLESAKAVAIKENLWRDLIWGKLVVIPRKNRTAYRAACVLIAHGVAIQESLTGDTLYMRADQSLVQPYTVKKIRAKTAHYPSAQSHVKGTIAKNKS